MLATIGNEQLFDSPKGLHIKGPKIFEYKSMPLYDIRRLHIITKGNVVGRMALYHNLHPSSAAGIHMFIFTVNKTIKIEIRIQNIIFLFIFNCFISRILNRIINNHKIITIVVKSLPIYIYDKYNYNS